MIVAIEKIPEFAEYGEIDHVTLSNHFKSVCYNAAELFEFFEKGVARGIPSLKAKTNKKLLEKALAGVKRRKRDWSLICNDIKHNSNMLLPVEEIYRRSQRRVLGYSLIRPKGTDAYTVNKEVHKDPERCRTYLRSAHQILADIFHADECIARLLRQVDNDPCAQQPRDLEAAMPIARILPNFVEIEVKAFQDENKMFDRCVIENGNICFRRSQAYTIPEAAQRRVLYTGDGLTRHFPII